MKTLAIETSCDDTSLAIVSFDGEQFGVEKMLAYTQTKEHEQRGGVVPELSARTHADKIMTVLEELGGETLRDEIDFISVTSHPGLPGALIVGITTAYTLGKLRNKPVVEVNHIMGHVFSLLVERRLDVLQLPYLCLTVSGGHNDLYLVDKGQVTGDKRKVGSGELKVEDEEMIKGGSDEMKKGETAKDSFSHVHNSSISHTKHQHIPLGGSVEVGSFVVTKLGQSIDDASGEVFDKVARMLGGPYPGGKWIGDLALSGKVNEQIHLHAAKLPDQPLNFSFSGIKSQVHTLVESGKVKIENGQVTGDKGQGNIEYETGELENDQWKADVAWRFQEEVTSNLADKLAFAAARFAPQTLGLVGGVSANTRLRECVSSHPELQEQTVRTPSKFVYCTDNAAMIGVVGLLMKNE